MDGVYVLLLFGFLTKINPFVEFIPPAATPSVISASVIVSYVIFADVSLALTIRLPLILVESKIALYETPLVPADIPLPAAIVVFADPVTNTTVPPDI